MVVEGHGEDGERCGVAEFLGCVGIQGEERDGDVLEEEDCVDGEVFDCGRHRAGRS